MDITAAAKVILSSEDKTGPGTESAKKNVQGVGGAADVARKAFERLVAIVGSVSFARTIMDAIETADRLNDMAKKTGIAVEQLGGLQYAFSQAGVDSATLEKSLTKLGVNMAEAAGGNKELGAAFSALGINVRDAQGHLKGADETLLEMADRFADLADSPEKTALAIKTLGKAGADLISGLDDGSAKIREAIAEYEKYGGVTTGVAQAADAFNDTIAKLQLMFGALFRTIASAVLPTLQTLANQFAQTKNTSEGFRVIAEGVVVVLKLIATVAIGVIEAFKALGTSIGAVFAAFSLAIQGDFKGAWSALKLGFTDVSASIKQSIGRVREVWSADTQVMAATADENLNKKPKASIAKMVEDSSKEMQKLVDQFNALVSALQGKDLGIDSSFAAKFALLTKAYNGEIKGVNLSLEDYRDLTAELLEQQPFAKKQREELEKLIKVEQEYLDIQAKQAQEATATLGHYAEENDRIVLEVSLIGQDNLARQRALIIADAEIEKKKLIAAGDVQGLDLLQQQIDKRLELAGIADTKQKAIDYQNAWLDAITNVSSAGADFIVDFVEHGTSAFRNLWDTFKAWALRAFAEIAARKVVVSLVGAISPGLAGAANAAGGGGSGGDLLGLLGKGFDIAKLFGSSGGGAGLLETFLTSTGIGSSLGAALGLTTTAAEMGAGAAAFGLATEGATAALTTFGAAALNLVPVIGTIAAAALIAYQIFSKPGGGPKAGGFASTGDISGIVNTDSTGRYFTPDQSDADIGKTVEAVKNGYIEAVKALGLTEKNIGFALGFDTDPQGTAPNRIHATTFEDGKSIYDAALGDLGRDETELQERLTLETKRILFAAIQASVGDAPQYIQQLFAGIDAATISSDQIDQILGTAQALKVVVDTIAKMGDQFAAMDPDQITALVEAFGGLQAFLDNAGFLQANFTTDADKAAAATQLLADQFAAIGVAVPATHQAFTALLASLDLTTDEGRASYAAISRLAPLFVQVNGTAQQAADATAQLTAAEQKLIDARKEAIASATDFFNANFYSDQEQAATQLQANWDIVHKAWTEMGAQLMELGLSSIPTTNEAFRSLIETLRAQGLNDLADSLILIAPAIFGINQAVGDLTQTATEAGSTITEAVNTINDALARAQEAAGAAASAFQAIMASVDSLVSGSSGDFGAKLGLRIKLIGEQIAKLQALIDQEQGGPSPYGPLIAQYKATLAQLGLANDKATKELTRFTILAAQYDAAKAEQLVGLEEWYAEQKEILAGSTEALLALDAEFKSKWQAIIDGTSTAVDGAQSELQRLQQSIRDFLDSLKLGDLSPLTPAQKLAEAKSQYDALLAKAQGGDLDALGKITGAAEEYLKIARDFYASSTAYTEIFNSVIAALDKLATPAQGGAPGERGIDPVLAAALPTNGKMFSQADGEALGKTISANNAESLGAVVAAIENGTLANKQVVGQQTKQLQPTRLK